MTDYHRLKNQVEKYFWHKTIPMLSSGNRLVASLVSVGAYFIPRVEEANFALKVIFWACIGLSMGLGIGVLFG